MKIRNLKEVFDSLNRISNQVDIQTELSKGANIVLAKISDYVSYINSFTDKYSIDKSDKVIEYEQKHFDILNLYGEKEEDGSLKKDSMGRILVDTSKHDISKLDKEIDALISQYSEELKKYNYHNKLMYYVSENYNIPDSEIQYILSFEINEDFKYSFNSKDIEEFNKDLMTEKDIEELPSLKIVK